MRRNIEVAIEGAKNAFTLMASRAHLSRCWFARYRAALTSCNGSDQEADVTPDTCKTSSWAAQLTVKRIDAKASGSQAYQRLRTVPGNCSSKKGAMAVGWFSNPQTGFPSTESPPRACFAHDGGNGQAGSLNGGANYRFCPFSVMWGILDHDAD